MAPGNTKLVNFICSGLRGFIFNEIILIFAYYAIKWNLFLLTNTQQQMKKSTYSSPLAEVSVVRSEAVICASNGGSTEDFGTGTGFSFDLFEEVKPF